MQARIREIIQKYFNNSYSDRVIKEFTFWIKEPADYAEKHTSIKQIWEELDNLDIRADESDEHSFNRLMSAIRTSESVPRKQRIPFRKRLFRVAAVFMLPVISAGVTYYIMQVPVTAIRNEAELVECIVPAGEIRTITLPDSSVIKVNSGSILIYPRQFTDRRSIYLNGEAYFTVARNESKPFVVKTTDMDVEVLGTVFNVSSYADSEKPSATLESGEVNIRFKDTAKESVTLLPNEQVTYNRTSGLVEKNSVKVENAIAWTEGNLIIQNMTIEEVIEVIKRKYAVKIYLNSANYGKERITVKVTYGETLTEFMEVLQYLLPQLKYKLEKDRLYIY